MSESVWDLLRREAQSRMPGEFLECTLLGYPPCRAVNGQLERYVPQYIATLAIAHGLEAIMATEDRYTFRVK